MKVNPEYSSRFRILKGGKISLVVSALLGSVTLSFAAPSGGVVTSGSATINQSGKVTNINQSTQKASINWQKFNVAVDETVNFNQPNVNSITLNRVVGNERSVINGALNANGQVWILNSNGVLFGKNASINTAGLLATTKELSNQDFNTGNYNFKGSSTESVINLGEIDISNSGYAILLANSVSNERTIKAVKGSVRLIGANEVMINLNGNSILDLTVNKGVLDALVENKGAIYADGGQVYLTTNAVDELLKGVVNNTGIIEANSLDGVTGYVELFAHGGTANVAGTINAIDGFVETSADKVKIADDFRVKAKTWLIDPTDFTIAASGGDITGSTLSANLADLVIIESTNGATEGAGNIYVNDEVSWTNEASLVLKAQNNIFINSEITATNGDLALLYGQGAVASGNTSNYYINAKINLGAGADKFTTQLGSDGDYISWTVVNDINTLQNISDGHYVLGADIDASATSSWNSGKGWNSLGDEASNFTGNFDGLGHTISDLYINRPTEDNVGLFGYVGNYSTIRNIGIVDATITGKFYVGALAGFLDSSTVLNSYSSGAINGSSSVGGLLGFLYGSTIDNSYATGIVNATGNFVGGLIGNNDTSSTIKNSYASTEVSGNDYVGGLVGSNSGTSTIENSYATGTVTGHDYVGGLVGLNDIASIIKNSYAVGTVTGRSYIGGLVGTNDAASTIENSYASGTVSGSGIVGGLVGRNNDNSTIKNSYAIATVSGTNYVGGLVGYTKDYAVIENSYASGTVTGNTYVGGLYGGSLAYSVFTNSYYDNETNTGTFSDSTTYGKTKSQIVALAKTNWDSTLWYMGRGADVEGYQTVELPYLQDVTRNEDKSAVVILFDGGYGTSFDPYTITNWKQLQNINNANVLTENYFFQLLNNLSNATSDYTNLASSTANGGAGWNPIGNGSTSFTGYFDGLGHTISDLYINRDVAYTGLFGTANNATIKNIGLENINISGTHNVGGLVGFNQGNGLIENAYAIGTVSGGNYVGGLVGNSRTSIYNSYARGSVAGTDYVGGLVGTRVMGIIDNSYAAGTVSGTTSNKGGLAGSGSNPAITDSYYDNEINTGDMKDYSAHGKTTAQMQNSQTFMDAEWSIEEDSTVNKGTPFLAWQKSGNGYTTTWVIGTKVASTGGGSTGGGSTGGGSTGGGTTGGGSTLTPKVEEQQKEIQKVITTISNQNALMVTPPTIQTTTSTPNSLGQNVAVNFNAGGNQALISQPIEGQNTQRISLSEARQMQQENGVNSQEVRVPLSRSSMIELVDGGVNLPLGIEQEFYVAQEL